MRLFTKNHPEKGNNANFALGLFGQFAWQACGERRRAYQKTKSGLCFVKISSGDAFVSLSLSAGGAFVVFFIFRF